MIRQICGHFSFHDYVFKSPDRFTLLLSEGTIIDVINRYNHFDFSLRSTSRKKDTKLHELIHLSATGIGFLLDSPTFASFPTKPTEALCLYEKDDLTDEIVFELVEYDIRFDQTSGKSIFVETGKPRILKLRRIEFEQFINKLISNDILESAVEYYLNAMDQPYLYLVSLYKVHEILKNRDVISKTAAKKFTRIANDPNILIARHASSESGNFRRLTFNEDKLCHDIIRSGIICYADRCSAKANNRIQPKPAFNQ